MTKEEALNVLRRWPRWTRPEDKFVKERLVKEGKAGPLDGVTWHPDLLAMPADEQLGRLRLIERLCRLAGARCWRIKQTAYCGTGVFTKFVVRVVITPSSNQAEDDVLLRLDVYPQYLINHAVKAAAE